MSELLADRIREATRLLPQSNGREGAHEDEGTTDEPHRCGRHIVIVAKMIIAAIHRHHEDDGEGQQRHKDEQDGNDERHLNEGCVDRHDRRIMQFLR